MHFDNVLPAGHGHRPAGVHRENGEPREDGERAQLVEERDRRARRNESLRVEIGEGG